MVNGPAVAAGVDSCQQTSKKVQRSCQARVLSDYLLASAKCDNVPDPAERKACQVQALADLKDAQQTCRDQFAARQIVCDRLGGAPYNPVIIPTNFVTTIDNPYFPQIPGTTRIYVAQTAEGVLSNVVAVTHNTVVIQGVTCVEVRDVVSVKGAVVEDTLDWFAQDKQGNVWYFGENTRKVAGGLTTSVEGTFTAGINGAKGGIIMKAQPAIGDYFRQEFVLDEGEDVEEVIGLNESVTVPYGSFSQCVKVQETTALEPDDIVHDYYAPGIGPVLSITMPSNERLELVQITTE
ncbi:MAG: hypothetical protein EXS18_03880 [Verrucomicrobiae bacterium]|nr:hypothetical protein [Verrucomicrobiae bacterium]